MNELYRMQLHLTLTGRTLLLREIALRGRSPLILGQALAKAIADAGLASASVSSDETHSSATAELEIVPSRADVEAVAAYFSARGVRAVVAAAGDEDPRGVVAPAHGSGGEAGGVIPSGLAERNGCVTEGGVWDPERLWAQGHDFYGRAIREGAVLWAADEPVIDVGCAGGRVDVRVAAVTTISLCNSCRGSHHTELRALRFRLNCDCGVDVAPERLRTATGKPLLGTHAEAWHGSECAGAVLQPASTPIVSIRLMPATVMPH